MAKQIYKKDLGYGLHAVVTSAHTAPEVDGFKKMHVHYDIVRESNGETVSGKIQVCFSDILAWGGIDYAPTIPIPTSKQVSSLKMHVVDLFEVTETNTLDVSIDGVLVAIIRPDDMSLTNEEVLS